MSGWVSRRRLYDSSALHIVGGNYTHFPPVPSIALVSLRSLRLNCCRLGSVLLSTVWGLHSVPTYISTRCSTHIPCHNMRPTGWDPLCSLPDRVVELESVESHVFSWSRSRESESVFKTAGVGVGSRSRESESGVGVDFLKLLESESGVGVGFSKLLESESGVGVGTFVAITDSNVY